MRGMNRIPKVLLVGGVALMLLACAEGNLDNGDSANVVLSISTFPPVPPVTSSYNDTIGACVFTLPTAVNVTLKNQPKSELVKSPFGDVVIDSAVVSYVWDDGLTVEPYVQSAAGTIAVGQTGTVGLLPLRGSDLDGRAGHSANIQVTFHGVTIDGKEVESLPGPPGGATVSVNDCIPTGG